MFNERFVRVDVKRLCELTSGADALKLRCVVDLTSRQLARLIEGKSPEQIREVFNLPDDLTEEEKLEPIKNVGEDARIRLLNRLYAKKRQVGGPPGDWGWTGVGGGGAAPPVGKGCGWAEAAGGQGPSTGASAFCWVQVSGSKEPAPAAREAAARSGRGTPPSWEGHASAKRLPPALMPAARSSSRARAARAQPRRLR